MLHRLELFVHHVLLSIAYCKSVAFHIFRARFLSVNFKEHIVFGVHKPEPLPCIVVSTMERRSMGNPNL